MKGINQILPQRFQNALEATGQLFYEMIDDPKFTKEEKRLIGQPYVDLRNFLRLQRGQRTLSIERFIK